MACRTEFLDVGVMPAVGLFFSAVAAGVEEEARAMFQFFWIRSNIVPI